MSELEHLCKAYTRRTVQGKGTFVATAQGQADQGLALPFTVKTSGQPQSSSIPQIRKQAATMASTNLARRGEGGWRAHFAIRISEVRFMPDR